MSACRRIRSHPYFPLPDGGEEFTFTFDGSAVSAREGDTVASALFAAGRTVFSRSFKYHRPRGLYDCQGRGSEALVTVDGQPNVPADRATAKPGMGVVSQNAWPSLSFDLMSVNDFVVPLLPNGFYYKMFHKPKWAWPFFEKLIRNAAGLGRIDTSGRGVETRYEKRYRFPDVCVIGSGPAGMAAALGALSQGKEVLLIEEHRQPGGHAVHSLCTVRDCPDESLNGRREHEAAAEMIGKLRAQAGLEILTEATAFGVYEDNLVAVQQGTDLLKIRAGSVVLAPGAGDRHLVFEKNDLPGIMTARGVERLIALHSIRPGRRAVVVTNHDGGYHTAKMLHGAGTELAAVVDARTGPGPGEFVKEIEDLGVPIKRGRTLHRAMGVRAVRKIRIGAIDRSGSGEDLSCDLVVAAAGFMPHLNLHSAGRTRPAWDPERQIFRAGVLPQGLYSAGEAEGHASFSRLYREGWAAGVAAARGEPQPESIRDAGECIPAPPPDADRGGSRHFICKCMDVTRKEARCSMEEGFGQVETLKRFTGMGMGPCQGKTCYEAVARLAALDAGQEPERAAPTTMRPPFVPVSFGVLAGRAPHLGPVRRTPMHDRHVQRNARFLDAGLWKRPESYVDPQEEALFVRGGLGIIDVSTLGKVRLSGPDILEFLHFLFPGKYAKLEVGRTRYTIMVGEDGILFEDGTLSHIERGVYYLSTTTGNQDAVLSRFWWWVTTEKFDVQIKNLSSSFAAVNIAGARSREFMQELVGIDMSNEAFPYMACRQAEILSVPVTLFRIGFTGELGYEIHFPAEYGESMWEMFLERGEPYGLKPFGVETQRILRLEKGHLLPGVDTDALSDPYGAGAAFAVKEGKKDFVGRAFLRRFKERGAQERLVSYKLGAGDPVPEDGVAIIGDGEPIGRVTSSRWSPALRCPIGLCWVKERSASAGSKVTIRCGDGREVTAEILDHAAFDPEGVRLKS